MAEQADLGALCQRQGSVLVLQQGCALGLDLSAQLGLVGLTLLIGSKAFFEILGILGVAAVVNDLIGRCIQSNVDGGGVLVCNDIANDGRDRQDRGDGSQSRP